MKVIKFALVLVLIVPTGLWLLADSLLPDPFTYFSFRRVFVQYSGVVAIVIMSVAMLLALRPKKVEGAFNGLDKMYRLHKWLGISALVFTISHWWFAKVTKWMVGWGWLERPNRRGGGGERPELGFLQTWFDSQRGLAETIGEWAFYAAAILIILALIKRFPYRWFAKTHQLLAVTYLLFVYHSIILLRFEYWSQPVGWLTGVLLVSGSVAAVMVLLGKVGKKRQTTGTIEMLEYYPDMRVMEVDIKVGSEWAGHRPGQFAFAMSDKKEGAHPYTIASAWDADTRLIKFVIKELGDHTGRLNDWLKQGMSVRLEGPYGCFDFEDKSTRQIWIGAGIGMTPFLARIKSLAQQPDGKIIDFFHPTAVINPDFKDRLTSAVNASNIRHHLMIDEQDGYLDGQQIRQTVPDWQQASIWFCGPPALGKALREDLIKQGLPAKQFHQELFQLR